MPDIGTVAPVTTLYGVTAPLEYLGPMAWGQGYRIPNTDRTIIIGREDNGVMQEVLGYEEDGSPYTGNFDPTGLGSEWEPFRRGQQKWTDDTAWMRKDSDWLVDDFIPWVATAAGAYNGLNAFANTAVGQSVAEYAGGEAISGAGGSTAAGNMGGDTFGNTFGDASDFFGTGLEDAAITGGGTVSQSLYDQALAYIAANPGTSISTALKLVGMAGAGAAGAAMVGGNENVGGGGGTGGDMPGEAITNLTINNSMTPEELALIKEQVEILREQRETLREQLRQQDLLQGTLFDEMGFNLTRDANGKITGITKKAPTEEQLRQQQITKRFEDLSLAELERMNESAVAQKPIDALIRERTLKGLKGELDVDPNLTRSLEAEEAGLRDRLMKQLGPGFETSTPGIQALDEFSRSKTGLITSAQRGELTLAQQLEGAREGGMLSRSGAFMPAVDLNSRLGQMNFGNVMQMNANPLATAAGFGGNAGGFNGPLSAMAGGKDIAAGLFNSSANRDSAERVAALSRDATSRAGMWSGLGQFGGMAAFAPIFGAGKPSLFGRAFDAIFS